MNMNREAVNAALAFAGNQPLADKDKEYNNSTYIMCKALYMPTLFTSLTETEWACARKNARLRLTNDIILKLPGKHYYDLPADCVKPISVDENSTDFRIDDKLLVTATPAEVLYYVYHNRKLDFALIAAQEGKETGRMEHPYIARSALSAAENAITIKVQPTEYVEPPDYIADDFPEWEFTPYDSDFWEYFSYRLGARLVTKLRADDGTRAQALTAIADQIGAKAVIRERSAESNLNATPQTWSEKLGLRATY
jgi:hypothetical protein